MIIPQKYYLTKVYGKFEFSLNLNSKADNCQVVDFLSNLINELNNVLEQEAAVYDDLLKISREKTRIIVKNKVTELEQMVKLEQALIFKVGRLEDERDKLVARIVEHLNIQTKNVSITGLLEHISGEESGKLATAREKLLKTIDELKTVNEQNSKLIKNSLEFINFSINLIAGTDTGSNNYGNTGQIGQSKKRTFFDRKL